MVIFHGYETSTLGLRALGVEEYLQLDYEGVPGNYEWRPSTWGPTNLSGTSPLDEQDDDIIYKYNKRMLGRGTRVYLQKMKIQGGTPMQLLQGPHQALRRDSACDIPLRNLVHDHGIEDHLHHLGDVGVLSVPRGHAKVETWTEDKVILNEGPRTLGRGLPQKPSKGGHVPPPRSHR
ncbi:hypothetical protein Cgig2_015699 [Carnegiea gigantea]|uniref:Uncharacterized protein n=1 Tax=Carnegiea gigantea TaxID=171969 RepID=A0A9Q1JZX3_9CARY|nr:hypothetical protein Cgig2_015699 [Carnegiea gigantea]